jgi:hypothetical protein
LAVVVVGSRALTDLRGGGAGWGERGSEFADLMGEGGREVCRGLADVRGGGEGWSERG